MFFFLMRFIGPSKNLCELIKGKSTNEKTEHVPMASTYRRSVTKFQIEYHVLLLKDLGHILPPQTMITQKAEMKQNSKFP